jgi:hypothetical protein
VHDTRWQPRWSRKALCNEHSIGNRRDTAPAGKRRTPLRFGREGKPAAAEPEFPLLFFHPQHQAHRGLRPGRERRSLRRSPESRAAKRGVSPPHQRAKLATGEYPARGASRSGRVRNCLYHPRASRTCPGAAFAGESGTRESQIGESRVAKWKPDALASRRGCAYSTASISMCTTASTMAPIKAAPKLAI